jgi:IS4 transposase
MSTKDEQILLLIEKLLDQKITELDARMTARVMHLQKLIEGNGKPGLLGRVENLENYKNWILGVSAAIGVLTAAFGIYIRGFVEELFRHVYER